MDTIPQLIIHVGSDQAFQRQVQDLLFATFPLMAEYREQRMSGEYVTSYGDYAFRLMPSGILNHDEWEVYTRAIELFPGYTRVDLLTPDAGGRTGLDQLRHVLGLDAAPAASPAPPSFHQGMVDHTPPGGEPGYGYRWLTVDELTNAPADAEYWSPSRSEWLSNRERPRIYANHLWYRTAQRLPAGVVSPAPAPALTPIPIPPGWNDDWTAEGWRPLLPDERMLAGTDELCDDQAFHDVVVGYAGRPAYEWMDLRYRTGPCVRTKRNPPVGYTWQFGHPQYEVSASASASASAPAPSLTITQILDQHRAAQAIDRRNSAASLAENKRNAFINAVVSSTTAYGIPYLLSFLQSGTNVEYATLLAHCFGMLGSTYVTREEAEAMSKAVEVAKAVAARAAACALTDGSHEPIFRAVQRLR